MATPGQTEKNADAALLSANEDVTNPRPPGVYQHKHRPMCIPMLVLVTYI